MAVIPESTRRDLSIIHALFTCFFIFTGSLFRDEIKRISKKVRKWIKIEKLIFFEVNEKKRNNIINTLSCFNIMEDFLEKKNLLEHAFI